MSGKIAFATLALAALTNALPTSLSQLKRDLEDAYTQFEGNGSVDAGWPSMDDWPEFEDLWTQQASLIGQGCANIGVQGSDNSEEETGYIKDAVTQVADESGVDSRLILAVVMQESHGCVRVGTTGNGVTNPGLMQSHNGAGNCIGVEPCPQDQIIQMIKDGTEGTADGDGLQQTLQQSADQIGDTTEQAYYAAARMYNSGSVNWDDLNDGITSTACYASDVANRIMGWVQAEPACAL